MIEEQLNNIEERIAKMDHKVSLLVENLEKKKEKAVPKKKPYEDYI